MHPQLTSTSGAFQWSWHDGICVLMLNDKDSSVNTLKLPILEDFNSLLTSILSSDSTLGLVVASGKKNSFLAGADISLFEKFTSQESAQQGAESLQKIFNQLADAKVPTVAAIHGGCLGGGTELALACHYRIASDHVSTKLGLPEVKLGLLPGAGGTQRLPRLIGAANALDMILTGKDIPAKKALKMGLVNDVAPQNQLIQKSIELAKTKQNSRPVKKSSGLSLLKPSLFKDALKGGGKDLDEAKKLFENSIIGRNIIENKSKEQIYKNTKGFYPAPYKALEAVLKGLELPLEKGLKLEAKLFAELAMTQESRSLINIFRMMTAAKKNPVEKTLQELAASTFVDPAKNGQSELCILGAGLMGSGIATVLSENNFRSVILDRDGIGMARGLGLINKHFDDRVKRKRIRKQDKNAAMGRVRPALSLANIQESNFVIEAVFEDIKIKHDMLKRCEQTFKDENFIFATNTSSIPIAQIAEVAKHPENVIGMHFFSPVPKMPLVEIIVTDKTSPQALSATYDIALAMKKTVLVVKDGPGFYTTRILAFMIAEALLMLTEGAKIEQIDNALESFGMPVGPITLLDEVGIDVGQHIIETLKEPFAGRLKIPEGLEPIKEENRLGRKNNKGFYRYENGKKIGPDASIYKHFKGTTQFDAKTIIDRCIYVFMNEAAHCLDEGIIAKPMDGDLGAIFGLGFPPFRGGPFFHAENIGRSQVLQRLNELASLYGNRFNPAKYWES